ncbi:MAG: hypothetical protein H0U70_11350 [Tatlockia sp.]|nr:hypothetical protein [Tatlockia sp.]
MNTTVLLQQLTARLPELEWKISALGDSLSTKTLPPGLFRQAIEMNASNCIAEIKKDIQHLVQQKNAKSSHFLAERIQQKISILVTLCHLQATKPNVGGRVKFGLDKISTRQQWLQSVEIDINRLREQQLAMTKTLEHMKNRGATAEILLLKAELGEVEKRLTLAKEAFPTAW